MIGTLKREAERDFDKFIRYVKKLEEENAELKSELSKFRDSFKKYRDYEKEELAESCYDLARENEKLKEEVRDLVERNIELDKKYIFVLSKLRRLVRFILFNYIIGKRYLSYYY